MSAQPAPQVSPAQAHGTPACPPSPTHIVGEELQVDVRDPHRHVDAQLPTGFRSIADSQRPLQSSGDGDSTFGEYPDSTTTSLASSVTNYRYEYGRRYHAIEDGGYSLPNDDEEVDRLNLQHRVWDIVLNGKLYLAPLNIDLVHEVIDIGCGTGAWCIDFADAHPNTHVIGIDLSPIQPHDVPVNCEFLIDDADTNWTFGQRFDYIHTRSVLLGIKNWDKLIEQCFASLRPGGWVELQEFHIPIGCDDGSAGPDLAVTKWSTSVYEAFKNLGIDSMASSRFRELLGRHRFGSIEEAHTKSPLGPWPKGDKEKMIGTLLQKDIADNLHGLSIKALTNGLGWSIKQAEELIPEAKSDLYNPHIHSYIPVDIFWARRPA